MGECQQIEPGNRAERSDNDAIDLLVQTKMTLLLYRNECMIECLGYPRHNATNNLFDLFFEFIFNDSNDLDGKLLSC
jgi:hypothetical protein